MDAITAAVRRHPLIAFFALAYAFAWSLSWLTSVSLAFGFLALFGPAVAALIVAALADGRAGVGDLFRRLAIWRVAPGWYAVALGLPALLSLLVVGLGILLGAPAQVRFSDLSPLTLTLFVLVIGEELGWRGFALPRLQARFGALGASLLLGLLWAAWHLPNQFIPGLEVYGYGFPAFTAYVVAMTVLFTWLANHTRESVLLAWLFHGAINTLIFINPTTDLVQRWWLSAAVYGAAGLIIVLATGPGLVRRRPPPSSTLAEPTVGAERGS
jgi:membrane protease YdiL (CAAX protease family)